MKERTRIRINIKPEILLKKFSGGTPLNGERIKTIERNDPKPRTRLVIMREISKSFEENHCDYDTTELKMLTEKGRKFLYRTEFVLSQSRKKKTFK